MQHSAPVQRRPARPQPATEALLFYFDFVSPHGEAFRGNDPFHDVAAWLARGGW
jgi:hypothetical protein